MVPESLNANRFELLRTRGTVSREPSAQSPIKDERLRIGKPKKTAAGIVGVQKSFSIGFHEAGMKRTLQSMLAVNRFDGYDCPGCAWPDPDDHRSSFEFCENGAKAFATEATKKRVTPQKMRGISVTDLSKLTDMELDKMGRITSPLFLKEGEDTYEEIDWGSAFKIIASRISGSDDPDENVFYTSGRASNEANSSGGSWQDKSVLTIFPTAVTCAMSQVVSHYQDPSGLEREQ